MKFLNWYHDNIHCPITWAIEKRFGYYSKISKIFRRIGHNITAQKHL